LNDWVQRLDDLESSMERCARQAARHQRVAWQTLADRLSRVRPALLLKQRREVLRQEEQRLHEQAHHHLELRRNRLGAVEARLRLLGPEQVLARGYSITMAADSGKVLRDANEVSTGQPLKTRLKVGEVFSEVRKP
jgi:exodeoxyribonuclease VII large subunit